MRRGWLVVLGLLAVSGTASAATVDVEVGRDDAIDPAMTFLQFYPDTAVVWVGDTVTWTAKSNAPHTATSPGVFDSTPMLRQDDPALAAWFGPGGFVMPGQSFNTTFDRPGDYAYFCKIHPAMQGVVHVLNGTAAQGGAGTGLPGLPGTEPQAANRSTGARYAYVAAGWGSGDAVHDSFGPADITVDANTTVVWTNMGTNEPHTVTSASQAKPFDSSPKVTGEPVWFNGPGGMMSLQGANKVFRHTFTAAGHFSYFCKIHPGMVGTVIVLEKPQAAQNTSGGTGGSTNTAAGSTIPGVEPVLLVLGLLGAALLARRRA